jgi:Ca2+-binding RTX toxin-like protein
MMVLADMVASDWVLTKAVIDPPGSWPLNPDRDASRESATFRTSIHETLTGRDGADTLDGKSGNDVLIGLGGADRLIGGTGRDTADYGAAATGVTVDLGSGGVAGDAAGDSLDSIENVTGSRFDDLIAGSALRNTLDGGAGNDWLSGGDGKDVLIGGLGADRLDGGSRSDVASYAASGNAVNVNLATGIATGGDAAGDSFIAIEGIAGSMFADSLTGNGRANRLFGNDGVDQLDGSGGRDFLFGGLGRDILSGGLGRDAFVFDTTQPEIHADQITDFDVTEDMIRLYGDIYSELGNKGLSQGRFVANEGGIAQDGSDGILYVTLTGRLFYDSDGEDSARKELFAIIDAGLDLTAESFFVF